MTEQMERFEGGVEGSPVDPERALAWVTERWGSLSENMYLYLAHFHGDNVAEAAARAGIGSSAVRNWRAASPVFKAAEGFIREGRKGTMAGLALARLERASLKAAEKLIAIATSDPDTARGQSAQITALNSVLDRSGLVPSKPGVAVTVNVGGDHRRLDQMAIDLWNARKASERSARKSNAPDVEDPEPVEAAEGVEVEVVDDGGEPRPLQSAPDGPWPAERRVGMNLNPTGLPETPFGDADAARSFSLDLPRKRRWTRRGGN